jgi:polar amino acid transport system permease protein
MHALHQVFHAFFNPHSFTLALPDVWAGFQVNLRMMFIAEALVLVFALMVAIVRGLPGRGAKPFRALAIVYTDFFRGTPIVIIALLISVGVPTLGFHFPGHHVLDLGFYKFTIEPLSKESYTFYGIWALTIVYTAYVTEVYRAGIESVHESQRMAARSLGLSYLQSMRYVVVPQAVRRVIPPLLNDFIGLQKDTAILVIIGAGEATQQAQQYSTTYFNFTGYMVAAVFFVLLTIPLARFTDHLIRQREGLERAGGHN